MSDRIPLVPRWHRLFDEAIEEAVRAGLRRAGKHNETFPGPR